MFIVVFDIITIIFQKHYFLQQTIFFLGKTLLAKAVASGTKATFLRVNASELVRKVSGEGPRLVRNLFKTAREYSPCILFIDEIDAIGSKRQDTTSNGEKEVQRTMLEMLNQLDGFDTEGDVKVFFITFYMTILVLIILISKKNLIFKHTIY